MNYHGVTSYDGVDIFCANKVFVSYSDMADRITQYRDPFFYTGARPDAVKRYFTKKELQATFTDDLKKGSRVKCPATTEDGVKTTCIYQKVVGPEL